MIACRKIAEPPRAGGGAPPSALATARSPPSRTRSAWLRASWVAMALKSPLPDWRASAASRATAAWASATATGSMTGAAAAGATAGAAGAAGAGTAPAAVAGWSKRRPPVNWAL